MVKDYVRIVKGNPDVKKCKKITYHHIIMNNYYEKCIHNRIKYYCSLCVDSTNNTDSTDFINNTDSTDFINNTDNIIVKKQ